MIIHLKLSPLFAAEGDQRRDGKRCIRRENDTDVVQLVGTELMNARNPLNFLRMSTEKAAPEPPLPPLAGGHPVVVSDIGHDRASHLIIAQRIALDWAAAPCQHDRAQELLCIL
jgi:hypothetical protein